MQIQERTTNDHQPDFESLFDQTVSKSLFNHARLLTGNLAAAEDLVADTRYKCYKGLHTYDQKSGFRSWAFRIMINAHLDRKREQRRRPATVKPPPAKDEHSEFLDPFEILAVEVPTVQEDVEHHSVLEQTISLLRSHYSLDEKDKKVYILREVFRGRTPREVAAELEMHPGAVRSFVHRARIFLKNSPDMEQILGYRPRNVPKHTKKKRVKRKNEHAA